MDWCVILNGPIVAVSGTSLLLFVAWFILKRWLSAKIDSSVRHFYEKELETHKARLRMEADRVLEEIRRGHADALEERKSDAHLFTRFLELLPSTSPAIRFLQETNLAYPFDWADCSALDDFRAKWRGPDYEFLDKDMEGRKRRFYEAVEAFTCRLTKDTAPDGDGRFAIPAEWRHGKDNSRLDEFLSDINRLGQSAITAYEDLVRTGRKKCRLAAPLDRTTESE